MRNSPLVFIKRKEKEEESANVGQSNGSSENDVRGEEKGKLCSTVW